MKIHRCDRCDKDRGVREIKLAPQNVALFSRPLPDSIDLCPDCVKALLQFFERLPEHAHSITLTSYEVANLRAALNAIGYPNDEAATPSPIQALNTGDWVGQLWWRLPPAEHPPNATGEAMAEAARKWQLPPNRGPDENEAPRPTVKPS